MRKLIAAINMTLDGYCDHTAVSPDAELHDFFTDLIRGSDTILYGRVTYQLMEYWRPLAAQPSGDRSMDAFAQAMDAITKVVCSSTLPEPDWHSARLARRPLLEEVNAIKAQDGPDAYVGSPGLIAQLTEAGLIDEYRICLHPVLAAGGLPLFRDLTRARTLRLLDTRIFPSGAVVLRYQAS